MSVILEWLQMRDLKCGSEVTTWPLNRFS
jgi:hypothetical protein